MCTKEVMMTLIESEKFKLQQSNWKVKNTLLLSLWQNLSLQHISEDAFCSSNPCLQTKLSLRMKTQTTKINSRLIFLNDLTVNGLKGLLKGKCVHSTCSRRRRFINSQTIRQSYASAPSQKLLFPLTFCMEVYLSTYFVLEKCSIRRKLSEVSQSILLRDLVRSISAKMITMGCRIIHQPREREKQISHILHPCHMASWWSMGTQDSG